MRRTLLVVPLFLAAACATARPSGGPASPEPVVLPPVVVSPPAEVPDAAGPIERAAARNWHLLDPVTDSVPGIAVERAYRELLAGKQPRRTVVVAVIDGGVDTAHTDLRANLWRNPREIPGNGFDDDGNGYVDDVYGWNFIGGPDGRNVRWDTFEVTRLFALCRSQASEVAQMPCDSITASFHEKRSEAQLMVSQVNGARQLFNRAVSILQSALKGDSLSKARVRGLQSTAQDVQQAKLLYENFGGEGSRSKLIDEAIGQLEPQLKYGYDPEFNPRDIVGDNYRNVEERRYGNRDVTGPDAKHGTHVAGIIAAVRGNDSGMDGVASAVTIMALRAVPDGDERDKDIANAVRYAVDNGAHIINMSFGKAWSPQKPAVDAAMTYASERGVLLVHAAGNDGQDLTTNRSFPSPMVASGTRVPTWIEVGALSWRGGDTLATSFSNYGAGRVDVFAPGEDILSTVPGGGTEAQSGTSMAAPVVTGLAALVMSYYPQLTAAEVKRVILESAVRLDGRQALLPGDNPGGRAPFASLSSTGGIVNAMNALQQAAKLAAGKPPMN